MISAKDGAFILRQEVTMLAKQYLLSFPLILRQRDEVLTIRIFRFASEQIDEVARTGLDNHVDYAPPTIKINVR
jgi:hypothetical protein